MDQIEVKVRAINEKSQRLHQNNNITVKKCDLKYFIWTNGLSNRELSNSLNQF